MLLNLRKYVVKRARHGMGLGLFVTVPLQKGSYIISYSGELISTQEADRRKTKYLFEIDERYTIDGSARENKARYMNHFCNPNIEAVIEAGEIRFYALHDIQEGEELGYDYGEEYFNEFIKPIRCKCPSCLL